MRRRGGGDDSGIDVRDGIHGLELRQASLMTRCVDSVFAFVRAAEFEILFVLFFVIVYVIFKDLTSRPQYNQILMKKPGGDDFWPY